MLKRLIRSLIGPSDDEPQAKPGDADRSPQWPKVRAAHLKANPSCAACGNTKGVDVHHVLPFHVRPDLELDPTNLVTLCGEPRGCHFAIGHGWNWQTYRPEVRALAGTMLLTKIVKVFVLALLLAGCTAPGPYTPATAVDLDKLISLHNQARADSWRGLKPLVKDGRLMAYAQAHANWMAEHDRMRHSSMTSLMRECGLSTCGENIAWGQDSEAAVMSGWLWSPGHRANIMGGYELIGVGAATRDGRNYWCACFGARR